MNHLTIEIDVLFGEARVVSSFEQTQQVMIDQNLAIARTRAYSNGGNFQVLRD